MSQFPISDSSGVLEAVNYLASGPTGLGQNFDGFHSYNPAYITSYYRAPFSLSYDPDNPTVNQERTRWYSNPINITNISGITTTSFKVEFSTLLTPPYSLGQGLFITGVVTANDYLVKNAFTPSGSKLLTASEVAYTNITPTTLTGSGSGAIVNVTIYASPAEPYSVGTGVSDNTQVFIATGGSGYAVGDTILIAGTDIGGTSPANDLTLTITEVDNIFNGYWAPPGVLECTDSYVIIGKNSPYTWPTYTSGGTIQLDASDGYVSTDANGRVSVFGAQDKVFVSAQINFDFDYESTTSGNLDLLVAINRYAAFIDTSDPNNTDYLFNQGTRIMRQERYIPVTAGTGSVTNQEFIFTTVIDSPTYVTQDVNGNNVTKGYGYYWYILEIQFVSDNGGGGVVHPINVIANTRSLTAQVIKQ